MKVDKVTTGIDSFGNIGVGDMFEYEGVLYIKTSLSGTHYNAMMVGKEGSRPSFGSASKIYPVKTMTYSLD